MSIVCTCVHLVRLLTTIVRDVAINIIVISDMFMRMCVFEVVQYDGLRHLKSIF